MISRTHVSLLTLSCLLAVGCSSFRQTVPAYCVGSTEESRSDKDTINFLRLRQTPPADYRLDARDVLGVYIEGILGNKEEPPPVHFPEDLGDTPPAIGYPMPVREDGTVSLPLVEPIDVQGRTIAEAEQLIRQKYVGESILKAGRDRIIVTLMRPRTYHVLVIREDGTDALRMNGGITPERAALAMMLGNTRAGQSHAVELRAYENDVLHALSETGGMPGNDALNEVVILRNAFTNDNERDQYVHELATNGFPEEQEIRNPVMKIPLRVGPTDPPPSWTERDIILDTGDVVFVRSREAEVFYTGGLLPGGQYPIPRDYDIDVMQAIALAGGNAGAAVGSNEGAFFGGGGRGGGAIFPATRVLVLREMCGEQVAIEVNTKRALVDPSERVRIQPGDFIMLEYRPLELIGNIFVSNFRLNYFVNQF